MASQDNTLQTLIDSRNNHAQNLLKLSLAIAELNKVLPDQIFSEWLIYYESELRKRPGEIQEPEITYPPEILH